MPIMLISMRQRLGRSRCQCSLIVLICVIVIEAAVAAPGVEVRALQVRPDRRSRPVQGKQPEQQQDPQEQVPLQNYAHQCNPPNLQRWPVGPPRVPPLPAGQKPNFIVILVDDMGFDDIGVHHPRGPDGVKSAGAQTPNLDKLIKSGMSFRNFYSGSLCAISRAALLTGRDAVRTGNLFNNMGYDAFSLKEATMGDVLQQVGYVTSHFGKWHNGKAQGYEPWNRGFNESWLPDDYVHVDNLMRHNGEYKPTRGLMELVLLNRMIEFMGAREADGKPFLTYYAPFAIHRKPSMDGNPVGIADAYFSPRSYLRRIRNQRPTPDPWTARLWAMLMYFDEVVGRLVEYVENSPTLRGNTYIMIAGDNGPALPSSVITSDITRLRRMPSGMLGDKNTFVNDNAIRSSGTEGSLRNHLAVWGPGIPSGGVSKTLVSISDILPTMAELAGATNTRHRPWSGMSFANLLTPAGQPTQQQENRYLFSFVASGAEGQCPQVDRLMTQLLPDLDSNREVMRPQPLLAYRDPLGQAVMKNCIVGRHKDYKWYGSTDMLFQLSNDSHIELPCNEVRGEEFQRVSTKFSQVARQWWDDVVAEPTSFTKPVYNIGQAGTLASNVEASGAIAIARGDINMTANVNFRGMGYACFSVNVASRGMYAVTAMYRARFDGPKPEIVLSVGQWKDVVAGTAPSLSSMVGTKADTSGRRLGTMFLETSKGQRTEVCIKLLGVPKYPDSTINPNAQQQQQEVSSSAQNSTSLGNGTAAAPANRITPWSVNPSAYVAVTGKWVFRLLNLRFVRLPWVTDPPPWGCCQAYQLDANGVEGLAGWEEVPKASTGAVELAQRALVASNDPAAAAASDGVPAGIPEALLQAALEETSAEPAQYSHFRPTPEMVEMERDVRAAVRQASNQGAAAAAAAKYTGSYASSESDSWRVPAGFASLESGRVTPTRSSSSNPKHTASGNNTHSRSSSSSKAGTRAGRKMTPQQVWKVLKERYNYEGGQGVFESLYRPCMAETKGVCSESC